MQNMNTLALLAVRQIFVQVHVPPTFDSKVISMIKKARCNLHTIGNHCAKYEHPLSNNEGGARFASKDY